MTDCGLIFQRLRELDEVTKQNSELREQYFKLSELVEAQVRTLADEIEEADLERSNNARFHESYIRKIDSELTVIEQESLESYEADLEPCERKIL